MRYLIPILALALLAPACEAGGFGFGALRARSRSSVRSVEKVVVEKQIQEIRTVEYRAPIRSQQFRSYSYAAPVRAQINDYCPPVASFRSYSYVQPVYVAPQYVAPVQQYVAPPPQAFQRDCCEEVLAELRSMRLEMQQRFPLQAPPKP